ncbi:GNAT family N-acetyltransferase [Thioalkalivibrio sp. ALE16]|uniref:GNAT family N-acetyltransferase n=1 Tax=Thioalkalivibrio sp. ALE16 TaxID=1158172 RepID=UPI0003800C34|nr:GNAT family N-acetyltransferase [Thioalkalivibrio sp. ALE16]
MKIETTGYCSKAYPSLREPYRQYTRVAYVEDPESGKREMAGWLLGRILETPLTEPFTNYSMEEVLSVSDDDLFEYTSFFTAIRHNIDGVQQNLDLVQEGVRPNRLCEHPVGVLTLLIVRPEYRRMGVGTRLVEDMRAHQLAECLVVVTRPQHFEEWDDTDARVDNPENQPLTLEDLQVGACDPSGGVGVSAFWDQFPGVERLPRARTGMMDGSRFRLFPQPQVERSPHHLNPRLFMYAELEDTVLDRLDTVGAFDDFDCLDQEEERLYKILEKVLKKHRKTIQIPETRVAGCDTQRRYFRRETLKPEETARKVLWGIGRSGFFRDDGLNMETGTNLIEWFVHTWGVEQVREVFDDFLARLHESVTA